jgi:hypothetical protein
MGNVAYHYGSYKAASALHLESLVMRVELGDRQGAAECFEGLALVMLAQEEARTAECLWGVAHALRESISSPLPHNERERHEQKVLEACSILGDESFDAAWEEGRAMRLTTPA